jgi:glyceraldehyde 3-phosphate dehydrogenase
LARVAINGLGRIGRAVCKIILDTPDLELVAINDIVPASSLAYLLAYDTVYGRYDKSVAAEGDNLVIAGKQYRVFSEQDPAALPWGELGIDIVMECSGAFTKKEGLQKHIEAGAKYAILSAPSKSDDIPTVVYGVNRVGDPSVRMISTASCTTNCITVVTEIMGRKIGIKKAALTAVHAFTASQSLVDGPSKSPRRGRSGAANLVPTSTGAAIATTRALPQYEGLFDGVAVRAPVICGSISDVIFVTARETTVEEVNQIFREEAESDRYRGILGVTDEPLVSSDIIGVPLAALVDLGLTMVVDKDLVKVMAWYDNEWGYASQMVKEAVAVSEGNG